MHVRTDLEFSYMPRDLFENRVELELPLGHVELDAGKAVVTVRRQGEHVDRDFSARVTESLRAVFELRQLQNHRRFELRGPSIVKYREDGKRDTVLMVESLRIMTTIGSVDLRVTRADGTVVSDSRAERLTSQHGMLADFAPKAAKSPVLKHMLRSYSEGVDDPANELVHLYEVRDAAADHFDGEAKARQALGISHANWSRFNKLANDAPIREGRHRGRHGLQLRPATSEELSFARDLARYMIAGLAKTVQD